MNKKILASIFVIGLLAFAMGWGTYSYFSSTRYSTDNVFTAGTLNVQLSNDGVAYYDTVTATWSSPVGWKPGDSVNAKLRIKNIGNIASKWLYFGISDLTGHSAFADEIIVTKLVFRIYDDGALKWSADYIAAGIASWGPFATGPKDTGIMTLKEFRDAQPYGCMLWEDVPPGILMANGANHVEVEMELKFNPDAGDEFQGVSCSFTAKVKGLQSEHPVVYYPIWESGSGYGYGEA